MGGRPRHPRGLIAGVGTGAFVAIAAACPWPNYSMSSPLLPVAQAIGRLGNWFNQELFGRPTDLPWGLEIDPAHRPAGYLNVATFHPTFLYEALWNLALAGGLVLWERHHPNSRPGRLFALYVAGYAVGRAWVEALRIDPAAHLFGVRWNIWMSCIAFVGAVGWLVFDSWRALLGTARAHRSSRGTRRHRGIRRGRGGIAEEPATETADESVASETSEEPAATEADEAADEPAATETPDEAADAKAADEPAATETPDEAADAKAADEPAATETPDEAADAKAADEPAATETPDEAADAKAADEPAATELDETPEEPVAGDQAGPPPAPGRKASRRKPRSAPARPPRPRRPTPPSSPMPASPLLRRQPTGGPVDTAELADTGDDAPDTAAETADTAQEPTSPAANDPDSDGANSPDPTQVNAPTRRPATLRSETRARGTRRNGRRGGCDLSEVTRPRPAGRRPPDTAVALGWRRWSPMS